MNYPGGRAAAKSINRNSCWLRESREVRRPRETIQSGGSSRLTGPAAARVSLFSSPQTLCLLVLRVLVQSLVDSCSSQTLFSPPPRHFPQNPLPRWNDSAAFCRVTFLRLLLTVSQWEPGQAFCNGTVAALRSHWVPGHVISQNRHDWKKIRARDSAPKLSCIFLSQQKLPCNCGLRWSSASVWLRVASRCSSSAERPDLRITSSF